MPQRTTNLKKGNDLKAFKIVWNAGIGITIYPKRNGIRGVFFPAAPFGVFPSAFFVA